MNVIAGPAVTISGSTLKIGDESVATWKDDKSATCTTELSIIPVGASEAKAIASGDILSEAGTLKLAVADEFDNKATTEINLTAIAVYGLENLLGKQLQVDQEANLLEGSTFAEGLTLQKIEIEQDNILAEIADPKAYTPEYPGSVNLILTIVKPDGSTLVERADGLVVNPLDYQAPQLEDVNVFETSFPWYKNLNQAAKNYVRPLLEVAYYASNRCRDPNTESIMLAETDSETENI